MSTPRRNKIVVLGYGIAGLTAAETLRDHGFDGELTIVGAERHRPYSRPALSKAALLDDDPAHLRLPDATHAGVETLGVAASRVDFDRRTVTLSDGSELSYDGLVIATGSRARRLTNDQALGHEPMPTEFTLRSLDDMLALRARLADRPSVVVVGGGPLGMEVASGALDAGCAVSLVSLGQPLKVQLGAFVSDLVVRTARDRGLDLRRSGCAAVYTEPGTHRPVLELADGSRVTADVLFGAVGDVPNLEFLTGSGALTDGKLLVDERCRVIVGGVARPDVVAAGDVASVPSETGSRRIPLWMSAIDQAKAAAATLLRGDDAPAHVWRPYFWTDQFGLSVRAAGVIPHSGEPEIVEGDPASTSFLLRQDGPDGAPGGAVAVNHRIPIPRLRRLADAAPSRT